MIEDKPNTTGQEFAFEMIAAERAALLKVNEIAKKYQTDPFKTIECFAKHMLKVGNELKTKYENDSQQGGSNHDELIRD